MRKLKSIDELRQWQEELSAERAGITKTITICGGTGCQASGCLAVVDAVKGVLAAKDLRDSVHLRLTGCHGFCEQGPLMVIEPGNIFYCHVGPDDTEEIVARTVVGDEVVERLLYTDPVSGRRIQSESEIPFYRAQDRTLLGQNKLVDPCYIEDYIAIGGYSALSKLLSQFKPEQVIAEIEASGLRGRGGGGYPTGRKWRQCRQADGNVKYVICNADEGDPGAYMDRSILEGNPHTVIEGMLIGAYAIGSQQGYISFAMSIPWQCITPGRRSHRGESVGYWARTSSVLDFHSMWKLFVAPAPSYAASRRP